MRTPDAIPRRTTVEWSERPYHGTEIRIRIEDGVTWFGEIQFVRPLIEAALARTAEQLRIIFHPPNLGFQGNADAR